MKKLLGISLFAVLAVTPLMASAADVAPSPIATTKSGLEANGANVVTAAHGKYYAGETISDADKAAAASAAYVKGAYNAAISAVNKVAVTADTAAATANNAANKDLSNLSATGKANVSAQGTYNASTNYTDGTVGAAIKSKADKATTLAGYGIADAYTKTEADGKFLTEHQSLANYATKEGVSASIEKAEAKGNISASVSGSISGSVSSDVSALKIGGGTITNTVTPTTVNIPTTWAGSSNMMVNWGDENPGTLDASVTSSGSQAVMTGVGVSSSLANATVTSGAISNTLSGTVSGTATQNNVTFDVKSKGYFDNASDTTAEYAPANS